MFTESFDTYVCDGESISCEVEGLTLTATVHADNDSSPPWERDDGHGPVSDWTSRDKKPGELILNRDGNSFRYYDFAEACRIAQRDGWGVAGGRKEGESARAYASRAALADFEALKAWCNDDWQYVGVAVTVSKAGVDLTGEYDHALWGIDANYPGSDNSYLREVANDLASEAIESARDTLKALADA